MTAFSEEFNFCSRVGKSNPETAKCCILRCEAVPCMVPCCEPGQAGLSVVILLRTSLSLTCCPVFSALVQVWF